MSVLSDYAISLLTAMYSSPVTVKLHTNDPTGAGTASVVSDSAYAAQTVSFAATAGVSNSYDNAAAVTFPAVSAGGGYTVSHVSLWDNAGHCMYKGPLPLAKVLAAGDVLSFAPHELVVTY